MGQQLSTRVNSPLSVFEQHWVKMPFNLTGLYKFPTMISIKIFKPKNHSTQSFAPAFNDMSTASWDCKVAEHDYERTKTTHCEICSTFKPRVHVRFFASFAMAFRFVSSGVARVVMSAVFGVVLCVSVSALIFSFLLLLSTWCTSLSDPTGPIVHSATKTTKLESNEQTHSARQPHCRTSTDMTRKQGHIQLTEG